MKTKLKKIIEEHEGNKFSGTPYAIASELLDRFDNINNLVIVGNPWCIEEMVYTIDEATDSSLWEDGELPEYTEAASWIDKNI